MGLVQDGQLAVLVPVLSLLGMIEAGRQVAALAADPGWTGRAFANMTLPSPEARRHLACKSIDLESGETQRSGGITECFRVDDRGRVIDTQHRLVSRESAYARNTDRDFIEESMRTIGVPFELAIVASEIGSYKPARAHWTAFERQTGRLPDVHVAASHFHDIAPATELGLLTVWINRDREAAEPRPTRELPDLGRLPETLDELVSS